MIHCHPISRLCASLALLGCVCSVSAQGSITLDGVVDASLRCTDGLSASNAAAVGAATAMSSGVNNTSRFGFLGSEDLGGGMAAIFHLESGYVAADLNNYSASAVVILANL